MQFERDRRKAAIESHGSSVRGVVDALVVNDRDLWVVVARHGERIDEWLHGAGGEEVAPLRVCRTFLGNGRIVLDEADPEHDRLLSEIEEMY